jgi:hypothetical protein
MRRIQLAYFEQEDSNEKEQPIQARNLYHHGFCRHTGVGLRRSDSRNYAVSVSDSDENVDAINDADPSAGPDSTHGEFHLPG